MGKTWGAVGRARAARTAAVLTDDDRAALGAQRGDGARAPRHVLHFWYCASERDAEAAAASMRSAGWSIRRLGRAVGEDGWAVTADRRDVVVDEQRVAADRRFFTELARRHHGDYDGWEYGVGDPARSGCIPC